MTEVSLISLGVTSSEAVIIRAIADIVARTRLDEPPGRTATDLAVCHAHACPLDLKRLLAAGYGNPFDPDFVHDIYGIRNHLNRETGKMGGITTHISGGHRLTAPWVPRFAARKGYSVPEGAHDKEEWR